ncbi:MAG: hypothetical protein ABII90_02100 [Bacteroidota bacterium]
MMKINQAMLTNFIKCDFEDNDAIKKYLKSIGAKVDEDVEDQFRPIWNSYKEHWGEWVLRHISRLGYEYTGSFARGCGQKTGEAVGEVAASFFG